MQTKLKAPSDEGACVSSNLKTFATVGTATHIIKLLLAEELLSYNKIY